MSGRLDELTQSHPDLRKHLFTSEGKVQAVVNLYLNDEDVQYLPAMEATAISPSYALSSNPSIPGRRPAVEESAATAQRRSDGQTERAIQGRDLGNDTRHVHWKFAYCFAVQVGGNNRVFGLEKRRPSGDDYAFTGAIYLRRASTSVETGNVLWSSMRRLFRVSPDLLSERFRRLIDSGVHFRANERTYRYSQVFTLRHVLSTTYRNR